MLSNPPASRPLIQLTALPGRARGKAPANRHEMSLFGALPGKHPCLHHGWHGHLMACCALHQPFPPGAKTGAQQNLPKSRALPSPHQGQSTGPSSSSAFWTYSPPFIVHHPCTGPCCSFLHHSQSNINPVGGIMWPPGALCSPLCHTFPGIFQLLDRK
eukprot:1152617-Pelagomonas_calceolata.AAC.6